MTSLANDTVTFGKGEQEMKFYIQKLPALAAFNLMERMRHAYFTGDLNGSHLPNTPDKVAATLLVILQGVMSLPPEVIADVRETLFEGVMFSGNGVKSTTPICLADNEHLAFANMEPSVIYELIVRCLVVNFKESFSGVVSDLSQLLADVDLSKL